MTIRAEFHKLPEAFLNAYMPDIMAWASRLREYSTCEIRLVSAPGGGTILDAANVQETATLMAEVWTHPVSGEVKIVVGPASEFDQEVIRLHTERLPAILTAQRLRAERAKRGHVDAEFHRIPDAFVQAYAPELRAWGTNFAKAGQWCRILLRKIPGAPVKLDDHGQEPMFGVELVAEVNRIAEDRVRLDISPADEQSEMLIARHCEAIERFGLPEARRAAN